MRRPVNYSLPYLIFLVSAALLLVQGCARPLLQTHPASEQETRFVVAAFTEFQNVLQVQCECCLDAEVDAEVSVSGWFSNHAGKLTGYLQAMEPGYIKFVALNPLGQPILILVTDGENFKSLNVLESKAYTGLVNSETFNRYAPHGFEPEFSYYWLTGRLSPGENAILSVSRDTTSEAYWLHIRHQQPVLDSMVLFDPQKSVILRHVILNDRGDPLVDLLYENHKSINGRGRQATGIGTGAGEKICLVPTGITLTSNSGTEKKIGLKLYSFIPDAEFFPDDFDVEIPENLEQLIVK